VANALRGQRSKADATAKRENYGGVIADFMRVDLYEIIRKQHYFVSFGT
jgi:hypothetical protein